MLTLFTEAATNAPVAINAKNILSVFVVPKINDIENNTPEGKQAAEANAFFAGKTCIVFPGTTIIVTEAYTDVVGRINASLN